MSRTKASASPAPKRSSKPGILLSDIRAMILVARQSVAVTVNSAIVRLYWHIGQCIRTDVLAEKRAEYGREILATLSQELMNEFGQGFSVSHLSRMMALAGAFPDEEILATLKVHYKPAMFSENIS